MDNLSVDAGVSTVVMNLYRNMDKGKVCFDFLICKKSSGFYTEEIIKNNDKIYCFGNPLSFKEHFCAIFKIKKFFKNKKGYYDIVHLHSPTLAFFTLKYAKKYGIRHRIVHSHSTMMSLKKFKTLINNYLIKKIPKYANHFWACSSEAAKFLYSKDVLKKNKVEIIKNAVNIEKFIYNEKIAKNIRKTYKLDNKIIVAHISNFSPIKNHMFLLDIIKDISQINNNVLFLFIGDGPTRKKFEKIINEWGLGKFCIFTGRVQNVEQYLMISDLVILPSLKEGLPVTIIEAQASGVPCIISDTITKEVNTGIVKQIPLKKEEWVRSLNNVEKMNLKKRKNNQEVFLKSQFNIELESKRVENLYMSME